MTTLQLSQSELSTLEGTIQSMMFANPAIGDPQVPYSPVNFSCHSCGGGCTGSCSGRCTGSCTGGCTGGGSGRR